MFSKKFWDLFKTKRVVRVVKIITESATFALILSIILSSVEIYDNMHESRRLAENLREIKNSFQHVTWANSPTFYLTSIIYTTTQSQVIQL